MFKDDLKIIGCSGTAGAIGFVGTLPLDYIKQNLQSGYSITRIRNNISNNGISVLFRGGTIGLKVIVPQMAIKYYMFNTFNKHSNNKILTSFGAGFSDGLFLGPPLAVQAIMQINNNISKKKANNIIYSRNIIKYAIPMALRNGFYTSSILGLGSIIKKKYDIKSSPINDFMIAMLLNPIGVFTCSPWDVIRAKQAYNLTHNKTSSIYFIIKDIYNNEGFKGYYRGWTGLFLNFTLRFPLTFAINSYLINKI